MRVRVRQAVGAAAMVGVVALAAGCGDSEPREDSGAESAADRLDFTVDTVDGDTVDGDTFDGQRLAGAPAVLWFWAPWCVVCASQAADVGALATEYDGEARVVGVAGLSEDRDAMREFVSEHELHELVHLADGEGEVWQRFEVTSQSTFVVLDSAGEVVADGVGDPAEVPGHLDGLTG